LQLLAAESHRTLNLVCFDFPAVLHAWHRKHAFLVLRIIRLCGGGKSVADKPLFALHRLQICMDVSHHTTY
jgi:hypothetical protein